MKWYSAYKHPEGARFIIHLNENEDVGYYIYLYEDIECFEEDLRDPNGCHRHQDDWLQDTLAMAKLATWEDFGVPQDSWIGI